MHHNNKKKICFILPSHYSSVTGGAELQVKYILEKFCDKDIFSKIYYLTNNFDPKYKSLNYKIVKIKSFGKNSRYGYVLSSFFLFFLLLKLRPDVIYQRVGCAYTGVSALYSIITKCKFIWHVSHDYDVTRIKYNYSISNALKFIEKKCLEYGLINCENIIVQTKDQSHYLKKFYNKIPIAMIPNFHPLPRHAISKRDVITVLWIANLKKIKQPDLFIRLASDFAQFPIPLKFLMIGNKPIFSSDYINNILKMIHDTPNIEYLGGKSIEEVNQILSESHIFVNTSLFEGFPNTFIQSWLHKVPTLSICVNPDRILNKNKIGYSSGNYEHLLSFLSNFLLNPSLIEEYGINARNYAIKNHSLANIDQIISLIFK